MLVLGFTLLFAPAGNIDRRSAYISLGLVALTTLLVLVPAVPGFHGDRDRRSLAVLSVPIAVVLLIVRVTVTRYSLRRQRRLYPTGELEGGGWPLPAAIAVLAVVTVVTAVVTETLLGSLGGPSRTRRTSPSSSSRSSSSRSSETRRSTAVRCCWRDEADVDFAVEIPLASSAQIAGLLIPLVTIISWGFEPLAFSFRPVELLALGVAAALPTIMLRTGSTTRPGGALLLAVYAVLVVCFYIAGDR